MRLNKPSNLLNVDHLVIKEQLINKVDHLKYLGSYVGSMEHDLQVRTGLAWAAFAKLMSILSSLKPKLNLKIRLFNAACVSILFDGCDTWLLTEALPRNLTSLQRHATLSAKWFTSGSSSSQVTAFACLPMSPSTALSYTNLK